MASITVSPRRSACSWLAAGFACLLHAFVPALFTDKASRTIRRLHAVIERRDAADLDVLADGQEAGLLILVPLSLVTALLPWLLGAGPAIAAALSLLSLGFPVAALSVAMIETVPEPRR